MDYNLFFSCNSDFNHNKVTSFMTLSVQACVIQSLKEKILQVSLSCAKYDTVNSKLSLRLP